MYVRKTGRGPDVRLRIGFCTAKDDRISSVTGEACALLVRETSQVRNVFSCNPN